MGTAERRAKLLKLLCRRRYETISNLASEFGVSKRTILRDIEVLSITEPIYTQCGRYGGGVYVIDDYSIERMYMSERELDLLRKLAGFAKEKSQCDLNDDESILLNIIITQYTKPITRKENFNEKTRKRID